MRLLQGGAREPDRVARPVHLQRPAALRVHLQVALLAALLVRLPGGDEAAHQENIQQHFPVKPVRMRLDAIAEFSFHSETQSVMSANAFPIRN